MQDNGYRKVKSVEEIKKTLADMIAKNPGDYANFIKVANVIHAMHMEEKDVDSNV